MAPISWPFQDVWNSWRDTCYRTRSIFTVNIETLFGGIKSIPIDTFHATLISRFQVMKKSYSWLRTCSFLMWQGIQGSRRAGVMQRRVNSRLPWAQNINGDPCNINLIWPWLYLVKDVPIGLGFGLWLSFMSPIRDKLRYNHVQSWWKWLLPYQIFEVLMDLWWVTVTSLYS